MNIERGLLWNQEPVVSRGVQANYTMGPLALSLSLNDGFYSDKYNWLIGLGRLDDQQGEHGQRDRRRQFRPDQARPHCARRWRRTTAQIINLIYTYNAAPWTITPYFQYTNVPSRRQRSASARIASTLRRRDPRELRDQRQRQPRRPV